MSLEKILKENPDIKIERTKFTSEAHFYSWYDKFSYTLPAQIIKEEQGIYGTKIYYIYVPSSKQIFIAEVPTQQNFVYTQDVIKQTVEQTKQKIQELKSQGATHIEISSPVFEVKDNNVNVQIDIKGYKIEKIPQQNLYSSLNQNNQNFNFFEFLKHEAMHSYYYKNLTYDPDKYINEYIIGQSKKLFGFAEYTRIIEKEAAKELMPPIPFVKEAWDAGVSIGNIVNAIFGRGKAIKVIKEDVFEINIPKFYYQGTELKLSPIIIDKKEYIEYRPVNILHEAASAAKDLFIAFSPWILQRIKFKFSEPSNEQIIQAYKEGKLVAIERFISKKELVKNPIFIRDLESYTKTNFAKEVFEKSKDIKLGIIEGFKEIPKEKLKINYFHTLGADRIQVIYTKAEEGKKLIDVIHIPKYGTFDVKETIQIYGTKLTGTKIKNIIHGTRTNALVNIHLLGEKALGFKSQPGPMKPFEIPPSLLYQSQTTTTATATSQATSQTLQQSQKILVPIVKEIQPITTTSEKTSSLIAIPHTLTKTQVKTQEILDQKYYLPLVNTKLLEEQKYKLNFATSLQMFSQQKLDLQTPINFQNLRNFQTNIQQNFITTPPISTTSTLTNTQTTTTNINIPQIKTPEPSIKIPIKIPKIKLPNFENKKLEKLIEKPREFKIFEEKIRFPSLYALSFNIKNVNNKIAKEIIRPLRV